MHSHRKRGERDRPSLRPHSLTLSQSVLSSDSPDFIEKVTSQIGEKRTNRIGVDTRGNPADGCMDACHWDLGHGCCHLGFGVSRDEILSTELSGDPRPALTLISTAYSPIPIHRRHNQPKGHHYDA